MVSRQRRTVPVSFRSCYIIFGNDMMDFLLHRSFWTLTGSPSLLAHPATAAIAKANNCSPHQAVYRVVQSLGIIPLCGTTHETHMREDISAENLDKGEEYFSALTKVIRG
jgi:diketogulonate reductase-like aldo/keto reductase